MKIKIMAGADYKDIDEVIKDMKSAKNYYDERKKELIELKKSIEKTGKPSKKFGRFKDIDGEWVYRRMVIVKSKLPKEQR